MGSFKMVFTKHSSLGDSINRLFFLVASRITGLCLSIPFIRSWRNKWVQILSDLGRKHSTTRRDDRSGGWRLEEIFWLPNLHRLQSTCQPSRLTMDLNRLELERLWLRRQWHTIPHWWDAHDHWHHHILRRRHSLPRHWGRRRKCDWRHF